MVVWKLDKKACFMVTNVRFLNGLPNQVIRPFENWTKKFWKSQMFGFHDFRWLMYLKVNFLDVSCIKASRIWITTEHSFVKSSHAHSTFDEQLLSEY